MISTGALFGLVSLYGYVVAWRWNYRIFWWGGKFYKANNIIDAYVVAWMEPTIVFHEYRRSHYGKLHGRLIKISGRIWAPSLMIAMIIDIVSPISQMN